MDNRDSGIGFFGMLCIAFIVLKLCSVINWSWWWVLSPLWGQLLIAGVLYGIACLLEVFERRNYTQKRITQHRIDASPSTPPKQSKFMQKLEQAMEENKKRGQKENQ